MMRCVPCGSFFMIKITCWNMAGYENTGTSTNTTITIIYLTLGLMQILSVAKTLLRIISIIQQVFVYKKSLNVRPTKCLMCPVVTHDQIFPLNSTRWWCLINDMYYRFIFHLTTGHSDYF